MPKPTTTRHRRPPTTPAAIDGILELQDRRGYIKRKKCLNVRFKKQTLQRLHKALCFDQTHSLNIHLSLFDISGILGICIFKFFIQWLYLLVLFFKKKWRIKRTELIGDHSDFYYAWQWKFVLHCSAISSFFSWLFLHSLLHLPFLCHLLCWVSAFVPYLQSPL